MSVLPFLGTPEDFDTPTETILDNVPIGIIYSDTDNVVRFINKTYAGYLRVGKDEALGRKITELIPTSRASVVMQSGVPELGSTCRIQRGDGCITLIVNRLPLYDEYNNVVGFISQSIISETDELKGLAEKIDQLDGKVSFYRQRMQSALSAMYSLHNILGVSDAIRKAKAHLTLYAKTESPLLILGETGSGKELFASALHQESNRADGPFVCINCAAIPQELFESELFGYLAGAFSGAHKDGKVGQIELADTGTLFLDEIGDMPLQIQAKLLRVIEDKTVFRVGATKGNRIDFRIVAATHRDLKAAVRENKFREDLYYRLNPLTLHIPPLCERLEDIPLLIENFLAKLGRKDISFTEDAMLALTRYTWPGNIRELRNVVDRAVSLCKGASIGLADLPTEVLASGPRCAAGTSEQCIKSLKLFRSSNEYNVISAALERNNWNMVRTAKALGISRATLYQKTSKLGLKRQSATDAANS